MLQCSKFHFALTQRVWHTSQQIIQHNHNHSHKKFKVDPDNKSPFPPSTSLWSSATHTRGATHPTVAGVRSLNSQVLSLFHVCAPSDLRYQLQPSTTHTKEVTRALRMRYEGMRAMRLQLSRDVSNSSCDVTHLSRDVTAVILHCFA